jgi:hypothetical protein
MIITFYVYCFQMGKCCTNRKWLYIYVIQLHKRKTKTHKLKTKAKQYSQEKQNIQTKHTQTKQKQINKPTYYQVHIILIYECFVFCADKYTYSCWL